MNIDNEIRSSEWDFKDEEFGEFFIDNDGFLKDDATDVKLSSIQKRIIDDEILLENIINNFSIEIINAVISNNFESGLRSEADTVFNEYHQKYGVLAVNWLVKLFITNLFDPAVVLGIIIIISRQKLADIGYQGQMILISATYQFKEDLQIQEAIIRCIENWESYELINILDQLHPNQKWLVDYKDLVIEDLRQQCPII